ncbi:DNA repair protein rad50, partial [Ascosphaera aggregata]
IARNEFPPVKVPPALHRATYTNPTILWQPDQSPGQEKSTHSCTSGISSQTSQGDLPLPILDLLSSIKSVLRTSFAKKPPHTVQRLAELIRFPKTHYATLPPYLRAVERVVSVSSGADIFPLPLTTPLPGAIRGTVNGYGGSMLGDDAAIEDCASDGASLTPITWLNNSTTLQASHHSPRFPNTLQDSADVPETDEVPHARGPQTLGVGDLGPQKEHDIDTPMSTGDDPSEARNIQGNRSDASNVISIASGSRFGVQQSGSEIEKLSILGIRSFDNTRSETIRFQTPLTLIVGENGSGKTTIIEALKYATTGELPPNSKGGAFIHDPKICREKEVLAQVKLLFKATTGARMVATRNLQLTVKKTTRQQKTLEGNLLMMKDGQRASISSRVAELDQILPQYLGVSKAILESVIFCHQEDTLWPMSEPSVLKKKFDDIFEASKYTKAIENIKALRKKQNELLSNYKIMEQHAKENKDKADKQQAEKRSLALSNEIETLRNECADLTQQMQQAAEAADKAWRESESYAKILGTLSGSRVEAQSIQSSIERLKEHLVEVDESDEWLESSLKEFQSRQDQLHQEEEATKRKYIELQREVENLRVKGGNAQSKVGEHKKDKQHYELQVARRKGLLKDIACQNNLRGFDRELDNELFMEFMAAIERLSREKRDTLNRAKEEAQTKLNDAQSVLNELEKRKSGLTEAKRLAKKQMMQNNREAETYQNELNSIDVDEGRKTALETRAQETEHALNLARDSARAASRETKISEKTTELQRLEEKNGLLNAELMKATERAGDLARLDLLKQELKDREQGLETMTSTHHTRLKKALGQEWKPQTLERALQERQKQANQDLYSAERDRDSISRDLDQAEERLQTARTTLQEYRTEMKEVAKRISDAIEDEPSEFPAILSAREEQLSSVKEESNIFLGRNKYLELCIKVAQTKNACKTCMRRFNKGEAEKTIQNLKDIMEKSVAEDIRAYEEDVQAAKSVSGDYD